jgi:hypothetical protein
MKRFAVVLILSLVLGVMVVTPVFGGSRNLTGTLVPGGPTTTEVAIITTPACTGATVAFSALYQAFPFSVDADGVYTITEPGTSSAVYVYSGSFDPTAVASNCAFASNSNPINFDVSLNAGAPYVLVIIDDTFDQNGLNFDLTISGPGNIFLQGLAVPTLSQLGLLLMALILVATGAVVLWRTNRNRARQT